MNGTGELKFGLGNLAARPLFLRRTFADAPKQQTGGEASSGSSPVAPKPDPSYRESLEKYGIYVSSQLPKLIERVVIDRNELTLHTSPENLMKVMAFLRDDKNAQFRQVVDVCGVDYPARPKRFDVVYHLLSHQFNSRIRVKTSCDETTPVPSITPLFEAANWFEREAWDMYGIFFSGHPDLRRILTDYGFEGHPQRKDFPLTGYVEVRYDDELKRVVQEPLELSQEFRRFDIESPWDQLEGGKKSPNQT